MKVQTLPITNLRHLSIILIGLFVAFLACCTYKSGNPQAQVTGAQTATPLLTPSPTPVVASGSGPCTLKISQAPIINGLKLGMTAEEVLALFPGSKEDTELRSALSAPPGRFGNSSFVITPSKYKNAASYKGISRINISMLDSHTSNFTINYNGPAWPDVDKFVEDFRKDKNLPPADQWEAYAGMDTQMKTLNCEGFSVRLFAAGEGGNLNYVLVQDLEADKKLKDRRKKAREQQSPSP